MCEFHVGDKVSTHLADAEDPPKGEVVEVTGSLVKIKALVVVNFGYGGFIQAGTELMLNTDKVHLWKVVESARVQQKAEPEPTPIAHCGYPYHHPPCDCKGMGGPR